MAEIVAIVKDSWTVILYFLPGYAFFLLYRYCRGEKKTTTTNSVIVNVIISILTVWAIQWIFGITNNLSLLAISMAVLLVGAVLLSKFVDSSFYNEQLSRYFHLTAKLDFWNDMVDIERGTVISIIRKDFRIIGIVHLVDTTGDTRWVQLCRYTVIDNEGKVMAEGKKYQEIAVKISNDDMLCLGYKHDSDHSYDKWQDDLDTDEATIMK